MMVRRARTVDEPVEVDEAQLKGWLAGRLPEGLYDGEPEVVVDREEITIIGTLPPVDVEGDGRAAAEAGRIQRHREETREQRMAIADELQPRYQRHVAWGARCGDTRRVFTRLAAPVMTRLAQDQRRVLDTLVDAGVARSRSEALAWCVKLVGEHEADWIASLREALEAVEKARDAGPRAGG